MRVIKNGQLQFFFERGLIAHFSFHSRLNLVTPAANLYNTKFWWQATMPGISVSPRVIRWPYPPSLLSTWTSSSRADSWDPLRPFLCLSVEGMDLQLVQLWPLTSELRLTTLLQRYVHFSLMFLFLCIITFFCLEFEVLGLIFMNNIIYYKEI